MGYGNLLNLLIQQLKEITNEKDYQKRKKELAIKKQDIIKELGISLRSINKSLKQLRKHDDIETIKNKQEYHEPIRIILNYKKLEKIRCKPK